LRMQANDATVRGSAQGREAGMTGEKTMEEEKKATPERQSSCPQKENPNRARKDNATLATVQEKMKGKGNTFSVRGGGESKKERGRYRFNGERPKIYVRGFHENITKGEARNGKLSHAFLRTKSSTIGEDSSTKRREGRKGGKRRKKERGLRKRTGHFQRASTLSSNLSWGEEIPGEGGLG